MAICLASSAVLLGLPMPSKLFPTVPLKLLIPATIPKMCSTKAPTCRPMLIPVPWLTWPRSVISVHSDDNVRLYPELSKSDWANETTNKQLPLAIAVSQNIIYAPLPDILLAWFRCCLAIPCFVQLHVQSSEILDLALCLLIHGSSYAALRSFCTLYV